MSEWVERHQPCEECGSSDGRSVNDRGWSTCFVCDHKFQINGEYAVTETITNKSTDKPLSTVTSTLLANVGEDVKGIPERGISPLTIKKFGIVVQGTKHIYPYYSPDDKQTPIAAQKRLPGKVFPSEGPINKTMLFGQQCFPAGGKMIVVVEGAMDVCAGYQLQGSKYPVVGVKNAPTALQDCKRNYEYLDSFDEIIVCMDADSEGDKAAKALGELFGHKAKLMTLPDGYNDPNDILLAEDSKALWTAAFWGAEAYTPDGIVCGADMWELVNTPMEKSACQYPYEGMNELTYGVRMAELVTISGGSGLGKSQFCREILWHIHQNTEDNIGGMFMEENPRKTGLSIMSLAANKPLHLPTTEVTDEEMRSAFDATLGEGRMFFFDHFGSTTVDNIVARCRYMAKALDCKYIFLDHLSIIVSAQESGDERKALDEIMTKLRTLVQELNIALFCVSHLKRPDGKGHEEGGATSLGQLRGSAAIGQLSDIVFGLERNGQDDDPDERNTTRVRVLKNRFSGETGLAAALLFDKSTGRMNEVPDTNDPSNIEDAL